MITFQQTLIECLRVHLHVSLSLSYSACDDMLPTHLYFGDALNQPRFPVDGTFARN